MSIAITGSGQVKLTASGQVARSVAIVTEEPVTAIGMNPTAISFSENTLAPSVLATLTRTGGAGDGTWAISWSGATPAIAAKLTIAYPNLSLTTNAAESDITGSAVSGQLSYTGDSAGGTPTPVNFTLNVVEHAPAGQIAPLTIINRNGGTATADRIIMGTPIKQGDCPDGSHLEVWRLDNTPIATQMLAHATLAADHPVDPSGIVFSGLAFDPGDSLDDDEALTLRLMRVPGSPSSTPPSTKAEVITALSTFDPKLTITSVSHATRAEAATENSGTWELALADALGGTEKGAGATGGYGADPIRGYWFMDHGALVSRVRAFCWAKRTSDDARHKFIYGVFYARFWHSDGHIDWSFRPINLSTKGPLAGHVGSTVRESLTYDVTVSDAVNGAIDSYSGLVNWASWSWFAADSKGKFLQSNGTPKPDVLGYLPGSYLHDSEHLWAFHHDLAVRDFAVEVAAGRETDRDYSPLNVDGFTLFLGQTGDRKEIGPFTTWGSKAIIRSDDAGWRKLCRVQELKAAHMPICDISEETGFPVLIINTDATNFPHLGTGSNLYCRDPATGDGTLLNNAANAEADGPWSGYGTGEYVLSFDHLASIGWIYLLEADERIFELMYEQVFRSFLGVNVAYQTVTVDNVHTPAVGAGVYERVLYRQGGAQDRDRAWHYRQMWNIEYWQPRDHPVAGIIRKLIDTNMNYVSARLDYLDANPTLSFESQSLTAAGRKIFAIWGLEGNTARKVGTFQSLHLNLATILAVMRKQAGWQAAEKWHDEFLINASVYAQLGRMETCPHYARNATAIFVEDALGNVMTSWADAQELEMTERGLTCPPTGVDHDSSVHYSQELRLICATLLKAGKFTADAQKVLDWWESSVKQTVDVGPATSPSGLTISAYHAKEIAYNPKYSAKIPT